MARMQRNTPAPPKNSGGSYTPPDETPDGYRPQPFYIKEKIKEMLRYALPILDGFPRRNRKLADTLRESALELFRLAVRVELRHYKRTTLEEMDIELATLKDFVVLASEKEYNGPKYAPPLTIQQREVWSRYNKEIGAMIGGYLKTVKAQKPQQ